MKKIRISYLLPANCLMAFLMLAPGTLMASDWTGATGVWSSTGNPGWNGSGVPDGVGASAIFSGGGSNGTTTQDNVAGVTVGTIDFTLGNLTRTITAANMITLNQDGTGAGFATISNSDMTVGTNRLSFSSASVLMLADNLLIINTGISTNPTAILTTGTIAGTGNITFSNVSNDPLSGAIAIQGVDTFSGSVTIQKGAVTFSNDKAFTGVGNAVTLGSTGNSASLYSTASNQILANNITVVATSGSNVIGSTSASASKSEYSGSMILNGNLTVSSAKTAGGGEVRLSGVVSGVGSLTTTGSGAVTLTGANTFTGDTRIGGTGLLQLGVTGATSLALQNSTVDLNAADSGNIAFGSTAATSIVNATFGGLKGSRNLLLVNSNTTTPAAVALSVGNNNSSNTYSGALSGAGSFTKIGTGTQTLSGANSFTGGTAVTAGTLLINGSNAGSAVTVTNANTTLGGTGTIAPGTSHSLAVGPGAIVAPGTNGSVGTLTVFLASTGDAASFASGAKFAFDLNAPGTNDVLAFTGLTASGGEVAFNDNVVNFTNLGGLAIGSYTLFTFDAATDYSGTLSIGTGLGSFVGSNLSYNSNSIVLNVVPEPSAIAITGIGLAGMLYMLRRRR